MTYINGSTCLKLLFDPNEELAQLPEVDAMPICLIERVDLLALLVCVNLKREEQRIEKNTKKSSVLVFLSRNVKVAEMRNVLM